MICRRSTGCDFLQDNLLICRYANMNVCMSEQECICFPSDRELLKVGGSRYMYSRDETPSSRFSVEK